MIKLLENTNLLKSDVQAIAHCCNCHCIMGGGIASQIKQYFPEAYDADLTTSLQKHNKLGKYSVAEITQPLIKTNIKYVYNLYGQTNFGVDKRHLDYEAIYNSMELMSKDCINKNIKTIGIPMNMGCGLAGGKWLIVHSMIQTILDNDFDVHICEYKG